ncbi:MAG: hydroxypyruvate isomerase family protein [Aquabacterium sp.]|jgi:hydroxypyruvate isomerase|nr:MAG: hydroxypyruvate isomerase family protein [Aquabacterium sp.]
MPRFAANLSWLYAEHPFLDRFRAAAQDGFSAVECLFPYAHAATELRQRLDAHGLRCVLLNAPAGDWDEGERGLAALPGREDDFRRSLDRALRYAAAMDCPRVHLMAGVIPPGADVQAMWATYQSNLAWAAHEAQEEDVMLTIEPINRRDMPGYLLTRQAEAHRVVSEIGSRHLRVQMDLYHCQIVEGETVAWLSGALHGVGGESLIGHMQVAGVPDRNEPDRGDVDYPALFELIDQLNYGGWIGCEYRPRDPNPGGTSRGLGWARPWLRRTPSRP